MIQTVEEIHARLKEIGERMTEIRKSMASGEYGSYQWHVLAGELMDLDHEACELKRSLVGHPQMARRGDAARSEP